MTSSGRSHCGIGRSAMLDNIRRDYLMVTVQLLAEGDGRIALQQRLIARLALIGGVPKISREFLGDLYSIRARRVETRDRLLSQLDE